MSYWFSFTSAMPLHKTCDCMHSVIYTTFTNKSRIFKSNDTFYIFLGFLRADSVYTACYADRTVVITAVVARTPRVMLSLRCQTSYTYVLYDGSVIE